MRAHSLTSREATRASVRVASRFVNRVRVRANVMCLAGKTKVLHGSALLSSWLYVSNLELVVDTFALSENSSITCQLHLSLS